MLKISLKGISKAGRSYRVCLGRDLTKTFSNKRKAEDYLRLVSKRMNETHVFISEEYLEAERIFRENFVYIRSYQKRFSLKNSLEFIQNRLDHIPSIPDTENKNSFIIHDMESTLLELLSIYRELQDDSLSRSNTALLHRIDMRLRIVTLYSADYKNFEQEINIDSNINITYNKVLKVV